jgi:hypothetical protein
VPAIIATAITCQTVKCPIHVSSARAAEPPANTTRLAVMMSRRLARSAMAPPTSPRTNIGAFPQKLTVPSHVAACVRS